MVGARAGGRASARSPESVGARTTASTRSGSPPSVTMTPADLELLFQEQLGAVAKALSELGADFMLIGGLAVGVWAEVRPTRDVDVSVHVLAEPRQVRDRLLESSCVLTHPDTPATTAMKALIAASGNCRSIAKITPANPQIAATTANDTG